MLARPTTFIIGAGASFDLNLPTGDGLQDKICEVLKFDNKHSGFTNNKIMDTIQLLARQSNSEFGVVYTRYLNAGRKIVRGMPSAASIDNFLHTHRGDDDIVQLGKIAIAIAILDAEANSHLRYTGLTRTGTHFHVSEGYVKSWYHTFVKMLTMGTSIDDPIALFQNVNFIVFNYDRCLELILAEAIAAYYALDPAKAWAIVRQNLKIVHPYGSLGDIPVFAGDMGMGFGGTSYDIAGSAARLKTFTEAVETEVQHTAHDFIINSEVLVFMGFGFLKQNMDLIKPERNTKVSRIHATTLGFSESDKAIVSKQLLPFINIIDQSDIRPIFGVTGDSGGFIDVENATCRALIDNHRMRLMGG